MKNAMRFWSELAQVRTMADKLRMGLDELPDRAALDLLRELQRAENRAVALIFHLRRPERAAAPTDGSVN